MQQLHTVFMAFILSRIIYALPAWGGHLTRELRERMYTFLKRTRKFFATQIIPRPNYLTRQMLGFLGLYKDQNTVFIIFYQILDSCSMEL